MALTRQLHIVVTVDLLVCLHQASVITSIVRLDAGYLKLYPAVVFSNCDSSFQRISGESCAVQQFVTPSRVDFTAELFVTVVKRMEGEPQDDGLIGLHPLLPLQELNI